MTPCQMSPDYSLTPFRLKFDPFFTPFLAKEVGKLGYEIEREKHGWEIKGVSPELLERYSKLVNRSC